MNAAEKLDIQKRISAAVGMDIGAVHPDFFITPEPGRLILLPGTKPDYACQRLPLKRLMEKHGRVSSNDSLIDAGNDEKTHKCKTKPIQTANPKNWCVYE